MLKQPKAQDLHQRSPTQRSYPRAGRPGRTGYAVPDQVFDELVGELFTSFSRSDQREKGLDYLLGLLHTPGRKSIRNMATLFDGAATGQSLHHFICSSTWQWNPVRQALATYLAHTITPRAWVVRPLVIPKVGRHSVGVVRYFSPAEGQVINAQRAVGVWLVSDRASVPVEWRLHLPRNRGQASDCGTRTLEPPDSGDLATSATYACLRMRQRWGLPPRPVILDLGEAVPVGVLTRLRSSGLLPLARVPDEVELTVTDPALIGHRGQNLPAHRIMRAAQDLRRPEAGGPHSPRAQSPPALLAAVRVSGPGAAPGQDLTLVGAGPGGRAWPDQLWLTTLAPDQAVAAVPEALDRIDRVDRSQTDVGDNVGIRDYAGRSYQGWHRHITLASAAHAISELSV
ncbi:IS701 family transposase [Nocardiopsis kunsanensis]|uniref:IS701 family transposase n=1 Tax=Nocardiopsis kunsanensis TaxID=141693 RepID=UPI001E341F9D|nr:transposase [Nocardiopsis kunsanensis]